MRSWFRLKKPPKIDKPTKTHFVTLNHDNGHSLKLVGVSDEILKAIQHNIGRDEIIIHGDTALNLKNFYSSEVNQT